MASTKVTPFCRESPLNLRGKQLGSKTSPQSRLGGFRDVKGRLPATLGALFSSLVRPWELHVGRSDLTKCFQNDSHAVPLAPHPAPMGNLRPQHRTERFNKHLARPSGLRGAIKSARPLEPAEGWQERVRPLGSVRSSILLFALLLLALHLPAEF